MKQADILRIYLQVNGLGDMKMPAAEKMSCSPLKIAAGEYLDTETFVMSQWLKRKLFIALIPHACCSATLKKKQVGWICSNGKKLSIGIWRLAASLTFFFLFLFYLLKENLLTWLINGRHERRHFVLFRLPFAFYSSF